MNLIDGLSGLSVPKNTPKNINIAKFRKDQANRVLTKMLQI